MFKAAFNYKPGKTDCLALRDSHLVFPEDVDCDSPLVYRVLGIDLNLELTFGSLLSRALAIGRSSFADLAFAAGSMALGLS